MSRIDSSILRTPEEDELDSDNNRYFGTPGCEILGKNQHA
jgi:hypothetical protein